MFERANPSTFSGMYQLWVQKTHDLDPPPSGKDREA
jgi:hypothetical protein